MRDCGGLLKMEVFFCNGGNDRAEGFCGVKRSS